LKEPLSSDDNLSFSLVEKKLSAHPGDINCVKFHPLLRLLVSCSDDGDIKLWQF
jgi:WD40 repeat protein